MKIHLVMSLTTLLICFLSLTGCSAVNSDAKAKGNESIEQKQIKKVSTIVKLSDKDKVELKGAIKRLEIIPSHSGLKDVYLFDESGNILEKSSVYQSDERVETKTINQYDRMGRKIGSEYYREGNLSIKSVFKYDAQNRIFQEIRYNSQGEETGTTTHKFDEIGNVIETVNKLLKSEPALFGMLAIGPGEYKEVFTYDENGNQNSIASYLPNSDKPIAKRSSVFNKQKQKVEETEISQVYEGEAPRIFKYFYVYNQNGDISESGQYESITESNVQTVKDKFKVIDNKNTVQNGYLISDKPGMILWTRIMYKYEYDSQGNWTKQTSYLQVGTTEKPVEDKIVKRAIQYF